VSVARHIAAGAPPGGVLVSGLVRERASAIAAAVRAAGWSCNRVAPIDLVEAALRAQPRLVLVGPDETAITACSHLKDEAGTRGVKVAILARRGDLTAKLLGLTAGADAVMAMDERPAELMRRLRAWFEKGGRREAGTAARDGLVAALGRQARARARRVARVCGALAKEMELSREAREDLRHAAIYQDLGMIALSESARERRGPLSLKEWATVRRHPVLSEQLALALGASEGCVRVVRSHHERPDGRGYPDGLSGRRIPEGARLLAVASAFDASARGRPYREALGTEGALEEIEAGRSSGQFDRDTVRALASLVRRGAFTNGARR
jgi:DNA-binding response OmpR family regulator